MLRRVFIFAVIAVMALIFARIAGDYREHDELTKLGHYYAEQGPAELGAPNLVTAVVVTYRGLDTLGEVTVLFISAAGVGLLLRRTRRRPEEESDEERERQDRGEETARVRRPASEIVETATQLLLPMVILFGVYVFLNGHLSPGGGFQGGAIIASGTMFLLLALPASHISRLLISIIESLSGFSYVIVGVLGVLLAGGFLDNRIMDLGTYGHLFSAGAIPIIYVFVGLKVGFELSAVLDRFRKDDTGEDDLDDSGDSAGEQR